MCPPLDLLRGTTGSLTPSICTDMSQRRPIGMNATLAIARQSTTADAMTPESASSGPPLLRSGRVPTQLRQEGGSMTL
jgi:hypothetical protein